MEQVTFGALGWRVSAAVLGCGGPSRLGQSYGRSEDESAAIVRAAIDHGVTFIDTASAYRTEPIVGKAIRDVPRDSIIISTKISPRNGDEPLRPNQVEPAVQASLERLGTDYIDLLHLHGVTPDRYDHAQDQLLPELDKLKQRGMIRATGVSEMFGSDVDHQMMRRAVREGSWDAVMVGFNLLNQSARDTLFGETQRRGIGVMIMFAVRRALSRPERLLEVLAEMIEKGVVTGEDIDLDDPLGFLVGPGKASSIVDAAYRFCRHEPGCDTIISGTGNLDHLADNVRSIGAPPLPDEDQRRLVAIFSGQAAVSGS